LKHPVHIIIAEPSVLLYHGLASVIANSGRNVSMSRAGSTDEVQRLVTVKAADAVIINPGLPQFNARAVQAIKAASPACRIIALVYAFYDDSILSLFDDRITINDPPEKIISVLTDDAYDKMQVDPDFQNASLSEREIEVLRLLASGMATKEIAETLHISTNTVVTHRKNLSVKTGIRSVSGLAVYAVVKKYITPGNTGI
jgi:DNA-binding NarL/FixJ family response regulator